MGEPMISNAPQNIDAASWYYEDKGSILLILSLDDIQKGDGYKKRKGAFHSSISDQVVYIRIPSKMLLATLKRQGKKP